MNIHCNSTLQFT